MNASGRREELELVANAASLPRTRWLLLLALLLATAWLYDVVWAELRHRLATRPEWVSTKVELERDVIGARCYVMTPMALAGDRLNLGAWHGFQEVMFHEPVELGELRWRMLVPTDGQGSVIYDADEHGFSGFRLSRSPRFPSIQFSADHEGRFLTRRTLEGLDLGDGWHGLRLVAEGSELKLYVDSRPIASVVRANGDAGRVGFRGALLDTYVDDVEILPAGGAGSFRDSFERPPVSIGQVGGILVALAFGVIGGAWLLARGRPVAERERFSFFMAMSADIVLLLVAGAFLTLEASFLSSHYGYSALHFRIQKRVERLPSPGSSWWNVVPALRARYGSGEPGDARRIFLIGTSQTWGAGASSVDQDIAGRLESLLSEHFGPKSYEVVNAGISGKDSAYLYQIYADEWVDWKPSVVLLNLGNNDGDPELLRSKLQGFVELDRSRGIETLFVLEANHAESLNAALPRNHRVMREVAEQMGVGVIDLHTSLLERYDDGFLWWDIVHLSDIGQRLSAAVIAEGLIGALPHRDAGGSSPPGNR